MKGELADQRILPPASLMEMTGDPLCVIKYPQVLRSCGSAIRHPAPNPASSIPTNTNKPSLIAPTVSPFASTAAFFTRWINAPHNVCTFWTNKDTGLLPRWHFGLKATPDAAFAQLTKPHRPLPYYNKKSLKNLSTKVKNGAKSM